MTDREMLEFAAKAAGINIHWFAGSPCELKDGIFTAWNPLKDDGDSRRLEVALRMDMLFEHESESGTDGVTAYYSIEFPEDRAYRTECGKDPAAAVRLAVLHVAAEIGKAML